MLIDETVRKKYELKYRIVRPLLSARENLITQIVFTAVVIGGFTFCINTTNNLFVFSVLFFVAFGIFAMSFSTILNKRLRNRSIVGFVQFFPHHMIISQKGTTTELKYDEIYRVAYSTAMLDDYFSRSPNPFTRYYKFICVDERIFFFECECFIQANKQDRIDKNLPDVGRVIKRIMPPGGIAQNKREIRKFLKKMKTSNAT